MQEMGAGGRVVTVGDLFDAYLENHAKLHCKNWQEIEYRFWLYLSDLARRDARTVRRLEVQSLHAELGQRSGHTTANRAIQLLRTIYNRARFWDLIDCSNPASGIRMFRLRSRARFLEAHELQRWIEAVDHLRYETTRDYLWMCLLTGARRRNVAAMRWDEISFERSVWTVPPEKSKNGDEMIIPLTSLALQILRRRKSSDSLWVFGSSRSPSGHLTSPERAWQAVKTASGLDDIRIHDLRRTMASHEALCGTSPLVIARTLGQRDLKSVEVYARLQVDPVREAMESALCSMRLSSY